MQPSSILLNEDEAAFRLGITKELLFAYTRNAPKKHLGNNIKLKIERKDQRCWFSTKELDEWNRYLQEPWSSPKAERPKIPTYIDQYLKVECGGKCALCGKGHKLENAHIVDYAVSLSHHHHNLIRLCTDCHIKYDDKIIPIEEIKEIKNALVQRIKEGLEESTRPFSRGTVYHVPQPDPLFVGRVTELASLRDKLDNSRVIIIEGIGGIGKTQLVLQALDQVDDIRTIWLDIESYRTFNDLKLAILTALSKAGLPIQTESSLFEVLNYQSLRIVLDGLDRISSVEWDQVVDLLQNLVQLTHQPRIIITTQIELSIGIETYKLVLPPLSPLESQQLILSSIGQQSNVSLDENDIKWLIDFCDGHTLSLKIVVGLLGYYKNSEAVLQRIRAIGTKELKDHTRNEQKRSTSLQTCLRTAYSCLNDNQKRLLKYASSFPAGCIAIVAEHWQEANNYHANLAELRRFFFIEVRPDLLGIERLYLLTPIRLFVRNRWKEDSYEESISIWIEAAKNLMMQAVVLDSEYLESSELENLQRGLWRVDTDLPNYIAVVRTAQHFLERHSSEIKNPEIYKELIANIAFSLSKYFFIRGLLNWGVYFAKTGAESLEQLGRYSSAATQYAFLSAFQKRLHDHEGHKDTTQKLLALTQKTGDPQISALASINLGEDAKQDLKFSEAIKHFSAAVSYFRDILQRENKTNEDNEGDDRYNKGTLSIALGRLGRVYEYLRQPSEALKCYLEALNYEIEMGDYSNLGSTYHHLGNCYAVLGDKIKALEHYKQAIIYFNQLGYALFLSNSLGEIGDIVIDTGLSAKLEDFFDEGLLKSGLDDVRYEVEILLAAKEISLSENFQVLRKVFGLVKLVSFTTKVKLLQVWAESFGTEVINPLLDSIEDNPSNCSNHRLVFIQDLRIALTIALTIISPQRKNTGYKRRFTKAQLNALCNYSYQLGEIGWEVYKPFNWLAALLRHFGQYPNIGAWQLQLAAERSIFGAPFKIPK